MTISHDPALVMLSVFVAITGAVTGLALTAGYHERYRPSFSFALFKGSVAIGVSIWAMHFIAVLAIRFPVTVTYNFVETMVSLAVAIVGAALGLLVVNGNRLGAASGVVGGALMGGTVAAMHYLGMGALRGCAIVEPLPGVIATLGLAIAASTAALWLAFRKRSTATMLAGGLLLGLTFPSVHYVAIATTEFRQLHAVPRINMPLISKEVLVATVAIAALAICGSFLLLFARLALRGSGQGRRAGESGRVRY